MLRGVSWNRLFHGSLVKPVIFHQRWPLPASPELLKWSAERLRDLILPRLQRRLTVALQRKYCIALRQRKKKKSEIATVTATVKHCDVVSAGDERKLQSGVGGCFVFSFSSHIVKLNGSQMSVSALLWLQEETKETGALLQNFCTCTCVQAAHIRRVRLDAHTGSRWVTSGPANRLSCSAEKKSWRGTWRGTSDSSTQTTHTRNHL